MKLYLVFFAFLCITFLPCCHHQTNEKRTPCELLQPYYAKTVTDSVFLPDSLGGRSVYGRIYIKVFFNKRGKLENFNVVDIKLWENNQQLLHVYKPGSSLKKFAPKKDYTEEEILRYYDFIEYYVNNLVVFYHDSIPDYCSKKMVGDCFLPIGGKKQ